jgi:hypothetical protein
MAALTLAVCLSADGTNQGFPGTGASDTKAAAGANAEDAAKPTTGV